MDPFLQFIFGLIIAIILHELTHLLTMIYYNIPFKAIVLTKWSAVGFLVDNESYVADNKKLFFLYFLPLSGCLVYFINPSEPFFLMFPIVNIFGGAGDFYSFFKLIIIPPEKRIQLANMSDEKVLKKIIWRKDFSMNSRVFNGK
ncbi:MAG TPA: metalloprotease family protein [Candidatus Thermoplasmatota archaeon]|nr:metalloprotease family protein [Candidatus Thermoplasmatota archaeon]